VSEISTISLAENTNHKIFSSCVTRVAGSEMQPATASPLHGAYLTSSRNSDHLSNYPVTG